MFEALSEGELLQFVASNLCGFFPGLEAGYKGISNNIQPSNLLVPLVSLVEN